MAEIKVNAGGNLQSAIDTAQPGDVITVEAGASFPGPIELPNKSGTGDILIQSSRASELPQGRVGPSHAGLMPKLIAPNAEPAIKTKPGAHGYKFVGFEVLPDPAAAAVYELVKFGDGKDTQTTLESVPHHLTLDRCYIHGSPTQDTQRGVSLNSAETTIRDCYISEIHGAGFDTQAICGWNGPGPFHIINNYLEGAGENILFGGSDSAIEALTPADIEIRRNYVFKPLSWKVGHPTYAGKHWTVKNLLELKNAKRVVIDGNVFENNWTDGQSGIPILFTVRNQDCKAPWSTIEDVKFTNNILKNAEGAFNCLGKDNEVTAAFGKCNPASTSGRGTGVLISNNLIFDINGAFLLMNGFYNVSVVRNTHVQNGNLMTLTVEPSTGFSYLDNLTIDHQYGIFGDGSIGVAALNKLTPGWVVKGNVIANPYSIEAGAPYPPENEYPSSLTLPADYRSPYAGKGCDIDALLAAQAGTVTGPVTNPTPTSPTPVPAPAPAPVPTQPAPSGPSVGSLRPDVPWTISEKSDNAEAKKQRAEGYYFKEHQSGKKATFVYTGVRLP